MATNAEKIRFLKNRYYEADITSSFANCVDCLAIKLRFYVDHEPLSLNLMEEMVRARVYCDILTDGVRFNSAAIQNTGDGKRLMWIADEMRKASGIRSSLLHNGYESRLNEETFYELLHALAYEISKFIRLDSNDVKDLYDSVLDELYRAE